MRVLITGIGGLIGGRFAHWLLENVPSVEVIGMDDFATGYPENVPPVELWRSTLGSGDTAVEKIAAKGLDYVFHFAAYAAEGLSPFVRRFNATNNYVGGCEVLNACLRHPPRRLVFTSSIAVYGAGRPPFNEGHPRAPIDPYGVAKAAVEQEIEIAGVQHGLDWCILRPHNVYGPGQSLWDPYRNVLGIWMARHLQSEPLLVYGDGCQRRAFSYIDDCLPAIWRAAVATKASRQIVNLGGTRAIEILDAAHQVALAVDGCRIVHEEARHEVREAWATWQKSVDLLGYQDRTDLADGLAAMWEWAREAWYLFPERRRRLVGPPIEVERGLYDYWQ